MAKGSRGGKRSEGNTGTQTEKEFIDDIVQNHNEFTRGDLQGVVEAYALSKNINDEDLMRDIDKKIAKYELDRINAAKKIAKRNGQGTSYGDYSRYLTDSNGNDYTLKQLQAQLKRK